MRFVLFLSLIALTSIYPITSTQEPYYTITILSKQNYTTSTSQISCLDVSFSSSEDLHFIFRWDDVEDLSSYTGKYTEMNFQNLDPQSQYSLIFYNSNIDNVILDYYIQSCTENNPSIALLYVILLLFSFIGICVCCLRRSTNSYTNSYSYSSI